MLGLLFVNQTDQVFVKLNNIREETSAVLSRGEHTCSLTAASRLQRTAPPRLTRHATVQRGLLWATPVLPAIPANLFLRMLQALLKCSNNSVLLRFQKHAREVKYRFATGEAVSGRKRHLVLRDHC